MNSSKNTSAFVIGLALFSMFFGSGNLIFPLFVGKIANSQYLIATLGFLVTAVLMPFSGVIAMVIYQGDYTKFFGSLGKRLGFFITALLLTVWIPLGSAPRCITLAHASILSYFPKMPSLWVFSVIYCGLVALVLINRQRILDILGYILTPALLVSLAIIIFKGLKVASAPLEGADWQAGDLFLSSMGEGYNTMDLIAAFFFSASIIGILKDSSDESFCPIKKAFKACMVGVAILGIVYAGLIALAAMQGPNLQGVPKEQLIAHTAKAVLGSRLGVVAAIAVSLACFTTSVAMVVVYTDFLKKELFKHSPSSHKPLIITLVITFGMSILGLKGITSLTAPILQVFYPILIILIAYNISKYLWKMRKKDKIVVVESSQS
ncbi:MAG: branched-chain amino acid transport system II carrier protein [Chlamydiota bacterium]